MPKGSGEWKLQGCRMLSDQTSTALSSIKMVRKSLMWGLGPLWWDWAWTESQRLSVSFLLYKTAHNRGQRLTNFNGKNYSSLLKCCPVGNVTLSAHPWLPFSNSFPLKILVFRILSWEDHLKRTLSTFKCQLQNQHELYIAFVVFTHTHTQTSICSTHLESRQKAVTQSCCILRFPHPRHCHHHAS